MIVVAYIAALTPFVVWLVAATWWLIEDTKNPEAEVWK